MINKSRDNDFFYLTGISNTTSKVCNESGYFSIVNSDKFGFNNPKDVWENEVFGIISDLSRTYKPLLTELEFNEIVEKINKENEGKEVKKPLPKKEIAKDVDEEANINGDIKCFKLENQNGFSLIEWASLEIDGWIWSNMELLSDQNSLIVISLSGNLYKINAMRDNPVTLGLGWSKLNELIDNISVP